MRLYELLESIDKDQESVGQVPGEESARKISPVLGKASKQHPFKGRLVGEDTVEEVAPPGMEDWIKDRKADFKKRYGDRWKTVLYATAWKRKKNESVEQGVAEGLNEFAPPGSGDSGDDGFSEETLKRLAAQWYNGDEDPRVERTLMAAGWEIGQDEGYDDEPGVFVVQSGDINGKSYISWPANELRQGVAEGNDKIADRYDQDEWDEKVERLKKLAGMGPLKTVWDPVKRVYKNVPVNTPKETDVDEASLATMRDYFAGNKDAHDEYEITKQRKYYQELKQKEELERRRRQELQKAGTTRIGGSK